MLSSSAWAAQHAIALNKKNKQLQYFLKNFLKKVSFREKLKNLRHFQIPKNGPTKQNEHVTFQELLNLYSTAH